MNYTGVTTIYSAALQTSLHRGNPHDIWPNSTIPESLALKPEVIAAGNAGMWITTPYSFAETRSLKACCVCIGNGGHRLRTELGVTIPTFEPRPHMATDAGLFNQIPFVVKPIDSDLNATDRARFCLRRTMRIGGQLYVAYFGRVLSELDLAAPDIAKRVITSSSDVSQPWLPTSADLTPALTDTDPTGSTNEVYVTASYSDQITFTEQDIAWLREACLLLYGSERYAYISEIAVCTGVKHAVTNRYDNAGSTTSAFSGANEYVGVQASSYTYAAWDAQAHATGFNFAVNTAVTEPLLGREN